MTDISEWTGRVGETWAEEWQATDRLLAAVNEALVDRLAAMLADVPAPHILDIGCGAGTTSLTLAERIAGARVTGVDLSPALIKVARSRAGQTPGLSFVNADVAAWPGDGQDFDALVSRHGVMFFADPAAAFTHLHGLTKPGAPFVFSCFRAPVLNAWAAAFAPLIAALNPAAGPIGGAGPGPFAFADPDPVETLLTEADFGDLVFSPLDFDYVVGPAEDPEGEAVRFFQRIGPLAGALRAAGPGKREPALEEVRRIAAEFRESDRIVFLAAAWIVSGRAL